MKFIFHVFVAVFIFSACCVFDGSTGLKLRDHTLPCRVLDAQNYCLAPYAGAEKFFETATVRYDQARAVELALGGTSRVFRTPAVFTGKNGKTVRKNVLLKKIILDRNMVSFSRKRVREQFLQEVVSMKALALDPVARAYVPEIYDWQHNVESDNLYISMEFLEGYNPLSSLGFGAITPQSAALVREVALAVKAIHAAGIVHHDICPENVFYRFIDGKPEVKIIDLGSSGFVGKPTLAIGHLGYLAPETIPEYYFDHPDNGHLNDSRVDVFSFGVLVSELFFQACCVPKSREKCF